MHRLSHRLRQQQRRSMAPQFADTIVDTFIEGPRSRMPPAGALVALGVGLALAVVVDRALAAGPPKVATQRTAVEGAPAAAVARTAVVATPAMPARRTAQAAATVVQSGSPTRRADLEAQLNATLAQGQTPYAATVLLEVGTGRVLAVAQHSTRGSADGLAFKPMAPAASVFKIVTASALLRAGTSADARVCIHGGKTRMQPSLLVDNARRDTLCTTLADALALSQNVAVAKLALQRLEPSALRDEAARFGFLQPYGADIALADAGAANIPDDPFGFANTAAGFGDVKLSALHGALLASTIAQDGVRFAPRFIDDDAPLADGVRVLDRKNAQRIARMMADTVERGTGRRAFAQAPRFNLPAAGKTGSLTDYTSGLDTTWFVGFAPVDNPQVAVATVVVNTAKWHVRAPAVAKEALRAYFQAQARSGRQAIAVAQR